MHSCPANWRNCACMQPARRAGGAGCLLGTGQGALTVVGGCRSETDEKRPQTDVFDVALSPWAYVWPPCGLLEASNCGRVCGSETRSSRFVPAGAQRSTIANGSAASKLRLGRYFSEEILSV